MSKLFKLKEWLTLREAARHLTTIFGEEVTKADILRLGLDHRLTLSVVFADRVMASLCKPVKYEDLEIAEIAPIRGSEPLRIPLGGQVLYCERTGYLQVQKEVLYLDDGCYDLTMMGGESGDVEQLYWEMVGGAREETISLDGVYVSDGRDTESRCFQLRESLPAKRGEKTTYYPAGGLPSSAMFVVRTKALIELERSLDEAAKAEDKPLSTTERNTLLRLVIGMAVDAYGYDAKANKSPIPKEIADNLSAHGLNVSDDTVRKYLKEAVETVLPARPRQS